MEHICDLLQYPLCQPHEAFWLTNPEQCVVIISVFDHCKLTAHVSPLPITSHESFRFVGWDHIAAATRIAIKLEQFVWSRVMLGKGVVCATCRIYFSSPNSHDRDTLNSRSAILKVHSRESM